MERVFVCDIYYLNSLYKLIANGWTAAVRVCPKLEPNADEENRCSGMTENVLLYIQKTLRDTG